MKKRLGIGSFSLLLTLFAILWSCNFPLQNTSFCLGDYVLTHLGMPTWSNGTTGIHYTLFWCLPVYLPAFFLGRKYNHHLFARSGKWLCGCICGCLIVIGCAFMIWG